SREQAPWVIKKAGIRCVIAKNFARIFYRNAFNIGLALVEADTDGLNENDEIIVDVEKGLIKNLTTSSIIEFRVWDNFRKELIKCGGIVEYLRKYKSFRLE
ncbi:MAG: 3-isopropylmalate dehydratase, partial [Candidatus Omnitrophota bacterium]